MRLRTRRATVLEKYDALAEKIDNNSIGLEDLLKKALHDKSPRVRWLAADSVGKKRFASLVPDLMAILETTDSITRAYSIQSIGALSEDESISSDLLRFLNDPDELVRVETAAALGILGTESCVGPLLNSLNDKSELVRSYAAYSLGILGTSKNVPVIEQYLAIEKCDSAKVDFYGTLYTLGRTHYLSSLLEMLNNEDWNVRNSTLQTLFDLGLSDGDKSNVIKEVLGLLKKEKQDDVIASANDLLFSLS